MKFKFVKLLPGILLPLILSLVSFTCTDNILLSDEEDNQFYPAAIASLSAERVKQLQKEFDSMNNFSTPAKLDAYGFLDGVLSYDAVSNITVSKDSALIIAANIILKNSKFTNVKDSASLLKGGYEITQDGNEWRVIFGPQINHGLEVPFVWIFVWIRGSQPYHIEGHWYPDAYIPHRFRIDKEQAKAKLIGEKITWHGFGGEPYVFIVSAETVGSDLSNIILPVQKDNRMELRVAWKIPVLMGPNPGWYIYVDVMNGERLQTVQNFVT